LGERGTEREKWFRVIFSYTHTHKTHIKQRNSVFYRFGCLLIELHDVYVHIRNIHIYTYVLYVDIDT
jgi:hypothetical protein